MNKVLKIVRSRFFISAFIILLQFIQLLIVFALLYKYSIIMVILSYIFYIGVFLYIINKYESPEFKLPWIIIIMLFFVFGAFIFILVMSDEDNKKVAKRYKQEREKLARYLTINDTLEKLNTENKDAYLQANYICKETKLPCYQNSKVTFYNIGEAYHQELLKELKKAKHFIFMEYFIIEEGIMWNSIHEILKEKVKNNVKVYVTYDDFGCMTTLSEDYYKLLNEEGIKAIPTNKLKPKLSRIYNNRDHRKITVIDGLVGFTGGINLADEYINVKEKYGHWKDSGIKLEGESVKSLSALFLLNWNIQNKKRLDEREFMNLRYPKYDEDGVVIPYGDGEKNFYESQIGKYVYINMLNAAKEYVYITTPYLICDSELLNAICICAKKGVDVRIITPYIPDKKYVQLMTKSNYKILIQNGVKIFEYKPGFIHAKEFICDDKFATCGTVNLDYRSLVHHFECGVWMYNTNSIKEMKRDFLETEKKSIEIKGENANLKGIKKLLTEVMKIFFPLF